MFSIDGIVSGFDTSTIIESLLGFQQRQIDTFNSRKAEVTEEQSAFKGIEAQLLTFRGSLSRLNRIGSSVFEVRSAQSSNEDIIVAAAGSNASSGSYSLTVEALAAAHQIGSQGFSNSSELIGTGEYTIRVGNRPATTVNIDSGNNTVSGFVDAINAQVEDVDASVVYDQGADSYRILLTSQYTGAENEISITNNADPGTGSVPDFSGDPVQAAADAVVVLGSGAGAIRAQYSTNQVEGLIEDVTLDLNKADATTPVTIQIQADNTAAKEAIESFVSDFNSVIEYIENQSSYNAETDVASPLLGNRAVSQLKNRLLSFVIDTVPGLASGANRLSTIGVDIDTRGRLTLDSGQLDKALNGEIEGIDPDSIRNLFGLNGTSTANGIEFLTGGTRTLDSETPYEVDITRAAEQATVTGTEAAKPTVVIGEDSDEFQITVDGIVSETLTLTQGSYTPAELAEHVEDVINNSSSLSSHDVQVSLDSSDRLVISTVAYGASASISSVSGEASNSLGFNGTENDSGEDVQGSFIVGGVTEKATGSGRILIGDSENENTADLQVRVTLSSSQVAEGPEAEILVTRGISGRLDQFLNDVFDADTGTLTTINEEFESRIDSIDESIERVQDITEARRQYLIAEFTALESIINELQTTGNFLSTQLASIGSSNNN
ncbi:MAG: flagellar filament capping protein FliD [Planctomycetota bacterium]